jgi:acetyl esterase/lipase
MDFCLASKIKPFTDQVSSQFLAVLCESSPRRFVLLKSSCAGILARMKCLLSLLALCAAVSVSAADPNEMKIWPHEVPGEAGFKPPTPDPKAKAPKDDGTLRIALVTEPTITLFRAPADKANGTGVLICPGGAYNILAFDKEGTEIAQWFNTIGVTAGVLKYRVPRRDKDAPHAAPLQDAQRGLRLMREHATEWGINPKSLGILGFSAGGNLAVMAGTHWDESNYPRQDAADDLGCRPDFLIAIYPAYLGDEKKPGPLSPLVRVTKETPPTFIAVTHDDALRGMNAALLYVELKKAGVPAELHIYTKGGHGYGMRPSENPVHTWPQRCEEWMGAMGLLMKK